MIAFVEGTIEEKQADALTINVGGVGFSVHTTSNTLARVGQRGEPCRVLTVMVVREDAMDLFGFATREERTMFARLTGISGIGPRTALGLLSALSPSDIAIAVMTGDAKSLTRAPGIGAKTAQRMILELKDRVTQEDLEGAGLPAPAAISEQGPVQEALMALMALGYSSAEATVALRGLSAEGLASDELIRAALRHLGGGA